MSETENCKAAGDSGKVENLDSADTIATEKSNEKSVGPGTAENGNGECLKIKVQEETCPLTVKAPKKDEQLAKVSKISENKLLNHK